MSKHIEQQRHFVEWLYEQYEDIQFLKTELSEVSRGLAYYERGDWDE